MLLLLLLMVIVVAMFMVISQEVTVMGMMKNSVLIEESQPRCGAQTHLRRD